MVGASAPLTSSLAAPLVATINLAKIFAIVLILQCGVAKTESLKKDLFLVFSLEAFGPKINFYKRFYYFFPLSRVKYEYE